MKTLVTSLALLIISIIDAQIIHQKETKSTFDLLMNEQMNENNNLFKHKKNATIDTCQIHGNPFKFDSSLLP